MGGFRGETRSPEGGFQMQPLLGVSWTRGAVICSLRPSGEDAGSCPTNFIIGRWHLIAVSWLPRGSAEPIAWVTSAGLPEGKVCPTLTHIHDLNEMCSAQVFCEITGPTEHDPKLLQALMLLCKTMTLIY